MELWIKENVENPHGFPHVNHDEQHAHRDGSHGQELTENSHAREFLVVVQVVREHHHDSGSGNANHESELADIFKDCEAGAIPATGEPYGLETFWDDSLSEKKDIYFEAGNHEELVHMTREEYLKLVEEKTHGIFSHHL